MIYLRKNWWFSSSYVQPEDRFGTLDGFQATNAPTPLPSQGQFGSRSSRPAPVPSSSSRGGRLAVGGAVEVLLLVKSGNFILITSLSSKYPFSHFFLSLSVSSQHHLNIIIRHLVIILTPISSESQSLILGHSFPKKGWPSSCSCSFWSPLAPTPPCTASVTRLRRCPSRCRAAGALVRRHQDEDQDSNATEEANGTDDLEGEVGMGGDGMGKCFWVCLMMLGLGPLFLGENWEDFGKTIPIWMDHTLW